MGKLKFTLSNILLYLAIIATCLILEDVGFLTANSKGALGDSFFFMLFAIAMGGYLSYFLIEHIKNKVSCDFFLLGILFFCFIGGCLAIWQFEGAILDGLQHYEYKISNWDKVIQTLSMVVYITCLYSILFYFNKNFPSIRKIKIVYFIILVLCLFLTIYSWIFETDSIIHNLTAVSVPVKIKSLFWNENVFSFFLLLGVLSCFGLNYYKKNVFSYFSMFYLGFFICVVCSLTAIIALIGTLLLYFLVEIIATTRKKKARGLIFLTIYLTILTSGVIVLACSLNYDMGGLSSFFKFLYLNFTQAQFDTLTLRTFTWSSSIQYIGEHPFNLLFGFGFRNSNRIIGGFWYAYRGATINWLSAHSGYIQTLMNFGLVGVISVFLFIVYYFYCFVRILKKDARFALIFIIIGLTLFGYATMESFTLFGTGTFGLLITTFFYFPMVNRWKHYRHKEIGDSVLEVEKPNPMPTSSISKSLAKLFMALIAVAASLFIFPLFRDNKLLMYLVINIIVVLFVSALTMPFIVAAISNKHSRKTSSIISTINFLIVASPIIYLTVRYYLHPNWFALGAEWLIPTFLVMILVGECLIFGVAKGMKFKDYTSTLLGISKNSFMGLIGAGVIALVGFFVISFLELESPLTYILYPVAVLMAYYLASYLVPFKDQKEFIAYYNESLLYSMKMDVLKDRLGDFNEKRRD